MPDPKQARDDFASSVGAQAVRRARARRRAGHGVWFGLGMTGLIGWSVAIPTLLGVALGGWIDRTHPGGRSWTLALLVAGLSLGALNAWRWVAAEQAKLDDGDDDTA